MGSIKDIYDIVKEIKEFAVELKNQPMIEKALELQEQYFNIKEEIDNINEKNKELLKEIDKLIELNNLQNNLIPHKQPYFTLKDDNLDRVFCANCWNTKKELIQLTNTKDARTYCFNCKTHIYLLKDFV
jgi:hypothetical protein